MLEDLFPHGCLYTGQVRRGGNIAQEGTGDIRDILGAGSSKHCHDSQQPCGVVAEAGECRQIFRTQQIVVFGEKAHPQLSKTLNATLSPLFRGKHADAGPLWEAIMLKIVELLFLRIKVCSP